jgi:hypothetical protein
MTNKIEHLIRVDGDQEWHINGVLHREDGPAYIGVDGYKSWWLKGKRHRIEGPAIERGNGTQEWYVHGKKHRLDGPAMIYQDGTQAWWIHDQEITQEVITWMQEQGVTWPWDESTQALFILRFA